MTGINIHEFERLENLMKNSKLSEDNQKLLKWLIKEKYIDDYFEAHYIIDKYANNQKSS